MHPDEVSYDRLRLDQRVHAIGRATGLSRRQLLLGALGGAVAAALPVRSYLVGAQPPPEPAIVKPTPDETFRVLGTNRETRFEALRGSGYLTPSALFFVRNHTRTPRIDAATWRLRIDGTGVSRPTVITYDELLAMRSVTVTKAVECAGNGRSFFGSQQGTPAPGTQWQLGSIGVARWTGVPLGQLLDRAALKPTAVDVMPEGLDDVVGADGHVRRPIPIAKALDDVLLVHTMNGTPLPPDHGFPVRVLVPGWVGIANVKWVGRIEVSETPLHSAWNTTQYRMLGDAYPDGPPVTTQTVKSAIELPFPATLPPGRTPLTGRAWSASARIRRVEVRVDDGAWQTAELHGPNDPGAWVQWRLPWDARPGSHVLRVRATDARGHVQPEVSPFNRDGYLFDAIVRHPVTVA